MAATTHGRLKYNNRDEIKKQTLFGTITSTHHSNNTVSRVTYIGELKNKLFRDCERMDGFGIIKARDGSGTEYRGFWKNGEKNGPGIEYYSESSFYTGWFRSGVRSGRGIYFCDNWIYNGDWDKDKMCQGSSYLGENLIYEGGFFEDKCCGTGILRCDNGKFDVGFFLDGLLVGDGLRWDNGMTGAIRLLDGRCKNQISTEAAHMTMEELCLPYPSETFMENKSGQKYSKVIDMLIKERNTVKIMEKLQDLYPTIETIAGVFKLCNLDPQKTLETVYFSRYFKRSSASTKSEHKIRVISLDKISIPSSLTSSSSYKKATKSRRRMEKQEDDQSPRSISQQNAPVCNCIQFDSGIFVGETEQKSKVRSGFGSMFYDDGHTAAGRWQDGKRQGVFKISLPSGEYQIMKFRDDEPVDTKGAVMWSKDRSKAWKLHVKTGIKTADENDYSSKIYDKREISLGEAFSLALDFGIDRIPDNHH